MNKDFSYNPVYLFLPNGQLYQTYCMDRTHKQTPKPFELSIDFWIACTRSENYEIGFPADDADLMRR